MSLAAVAARHAAAEPERAPRWVGALVTLRLALAIPACAIAATAVLLVAEGADMRTAGLVLALSALVSAPMALRVVFQLRVRNDLSMVVMTVNSVLWTGAVAVIAIAGGGIEAFAIAFIAVAGMTTLLQIGLAVRMGGVHVRGVRELWRPIATQGAALGIAGGLTLAYGRVDQVLVFELAGDRAAGLYGAVYGLLQQAQFIPIAVMTTLFPLIAAAHVSDHARLRRLVDSGLAALTMVSLPALAFALVAAEPAVELLFGAQFRAAAGALPILMAAFVVICVGYVAGHLIVIADLQRRQIAYAVAALAVNVALNFVFVPRYGFLAAAWITLATEVFVVTLMMRAALRALHLRIRLAPIVPVAVAAVATGCALWALKQAGVGLAGMACAAAAVYGALLVALGALDVRGTAALLRRGRG
jgi:O-antigen/teichoic acid export membrane protein